MPPGDAREDWAIFRALSAVIGRTLPYDSLNALRADLHAAHPHLSREEKIVADQSVLAKLADSAPANLGGGAFTAAVSDFYLTNPIARASRTMAECSRLAQEAHVEAAE